jgi:cutinase
MHAHPLARVLGVAAAVTSALLVEPVGLPSAQADPCPNVEVVFARGTNDTPGIGKVGQSFVDYLRPQIGGRSLGTYGVNYPATFAFGESANAGADDVSGHVQDMMGRCPNTKMVLGGISQGAGVMDFATNNMPPAAADHVAAVALFGNPTSALAGGLSGVSFPPVGPAYTGKTIDLCAQDDPACSGGLNPSAHGSYVLNGMTAQAANFVVGRL